ncbi:N-acyl-D-amino-acid deacylase family protein [Paenibacillus taiwanensis]|uniref:N-acyl-D-amino-acid deacylase family protein n=1 Tax=Paenibacillus taiwanensis TaxID=401638 RepID=UPI000404449A|nr:D-aminoacylase [Paenibacillus taiwanensis]
MLDTIIKHARIADGSGNPWYWGELGIKDGRITHVGGTGSIDVEARHVLDASGDVLAPGFIDGHCHSDLMIMDYPESGIKMQQGVTAEIVGNCGLAPAPFIPERADLLREYITPVIGSTNKPWTWRSVGQFMDAIHASRPAEHMATYVAHGALRIGVMGFENRPPTDVEMEAMKAIVREGMESGAIGLSIGLLYAPGSYATKHEIAELCRVVAEYGGLLSTHIRGEGRHLLPSIDEVIWIAEQSGVSLHVSHLKAAGRSNWGKVLEALERIESARARGMDVTCDVYPYHAGSTTLTTVLPPWILEGGLAGVLEALKQPAIRKKLHEELAEEQEDWDNLVASTGWHSVVISALQTAANKMLEGKSIAEVAELRGVHPIDAMMDLLLEESGKITIVYYHMDNNDIEQVIRYSQSLVASDSLHCETGKPHPRLYGTFPRLFAKYVRERKLISLEDAVRKVSSFPAARFRLGKRGLLVPGYAADLVLFNPDTIQDQATFEDPRQYPTGISHVFVSGQWTMEHGQFRDVYAGSMLRAASSVQGCCQHHAHSQA